MCDRSLRPIETIRVGEQVLARSEDGSMVCRAVVKTYERVANDVLTAAWSTADGQVQTLRVTPEHVFWIEGKGYIHLSDVAAGDVAWTPDGKEFRFEGRAVEGAPMTVYNLNVAEDHNYLVGGARILAHNCSTGG
jgi:hypothetical protein